MFTAQDARRLAAVSGPINYAAALDKILEHIRDVATNGERFCMVHGVGLPEMKDYLVRELIRVGFDVDAAYQDSIKVMWY